MLSGGGPHPLRHRQTLHLSAHPQTPTVCAAPDPGALVAVFVAVAGAAAGVGTVADGDGDDGGIAVAVAVAAAAAVVAFGYKSFCWLRMPVFAESECFDQSQSAVLRSIVK